MNPAHRPAPGLIAISVLSLSLAACGSGPEEAEGQQMSIGTAATASPMAEAAPASGATEAATAAAPGEASSAAASATASPGPSSAPSPTAAASASPAPSPAAKVAAAATAPAAFAICSACHSVKKGEQGIGPSLAGVYGTKAGQVPGYDFSPAMKASGLSWNEPALDRYLKDPMGVVPGTKMAYAGLKNDAQRKAVIDYLKSL